MISYTILKKQIVRNNTIYKLSVFDKDTPKTELLQIERIHATDLPESKLRGRLQTQVERAYANKLEPKPEPVKIYTEDELTQLLVDKKYITADQTIADLPVKAIEPIKEVVK